MADDNAQDDQESQEQEQSQADKDKASQELDPKALKAELEQARKDAAKYRTELRKLEAAKKDRDDAELSEAQKRDKRLKELEDQNAQLLSERQERLVQEAVTDVARAAGAIYPEDLYTLLKSEIEVSEDGKVRNARAALAALKERRPALFKAVSGDGGAGNGADLGDLGMNYRIRHAAGKA